MSSIDSSMLDAARNGDPVALFNCVVGTKVKITLFAGMEIEGRIHAADSLSGCIMIRNVIDDAQPPNYSLNIVRMSGVKDMQVLDVTEKNAEFIIPQYNAEDAKRLELRSSQMAMEAISRIGVNVSPEAQELFDALNKTMPCEWEEKNICVMHEVLIKPPYSGKDCFSSNAQVLSRVRKVLEGEKLKIGLK